MDALKTAVRQIRKLMPGLELRENEPMREHCSFKIGGPVRAMALPKSAEECEYLTNLLCGMDIFPFVMGRGTNLLWDDRPLPLFVVKTCDGMGGIERMDETTLRAESGVTLARLASFARDCGLTGLEFAHGIPGSLGGAVSMNAGAYGGEMKDVLGSVDFLDSEGELFTLPAEKLALGYRQSLFSDREALILSAELNLSPGDPEEISARMRELGEKRRASQPLDKPSAGSTFKRPQTGYAAALIDQCGLKGLSRGDAMVSEKHAGFVVNNGSAGFDDVLGLMEEIRDTVLAETGVELEPEVKIISLDDC